MEARIKRFLRHHHVLTLSTNEEQGSWTAHCFYAFMPGHEALVFTSDPETRHGRNMVQNPKVSGGIVLETKVIGKIRGLQLTGRAFLIGNSAGQPVTEGTAVAPSVREIRSAYLKRFPFAIAEKLDLWILHIDYIKMTDNRLGFGKKLTWESQISGT